MPRCLYIDSYICLEEGGNEIKEEKMAMPGLDLGLVVMLISGREGTRRW